MRLAEPFTDSSGPSYYLLTGTLSSGTLLDNRVYLFEGAQPSQIVPHEVNSFAALREQVKARLRRQER